MSVLHSNIQVFVQWTEQSIFAGEEVECEITFKNIATTSQPPRGPPARSQQNGFGSSEDRPRKSIALHGTATQPRFSGTRPGPTSRGHRSTMSLNVPVGDINIQRGIRTRSGGTSDAATEGRSHRRSVSILSLGVSESNGDETRTPKSSVEPPRNNPRRHARAASLQILPRRNGINGGPPSAPPISRRSTTHPSPLHQNISKSDASDFRTEFSLPERPAQQRSTGGSAPVTPAVGSVQERNIRASTSPRSLKPQTPEFKFPAIPEPPPEQQHATSDKPEDLLSPHSIAPLNKSLIPRSREDIPIIKEHATAAARILSPLNNETPRSSGEFYSLSNNSTETLASEYIPQLPGRDISRPNHNRQTSSVSLIQSTRHPETLMMGYAQVNGSFILDGSLVNQSHFDEVKRRGVLGGHGGGVIGLESNKRESGLLRNFGWSNIGESIGSFLGTGELSSIREMRDIASSKSIPLLSTPQSILFVDLRLAPGESRSFRYTFRLPRGLPPSHRGKAIKVSYNLVIGTQRSGGVREQQVKSIEIPFRVLGSVNTHGEILGHDLMSPYIILRDQAHIQSLGDISVESPAGRRQSKIIEASEPRKSSVGDFIAYIDELLTRPRQNSSLGLLSPSEAPGVSRPSENEGFSSARDAIDMAIMRSNFATDMQQSANRFEIARNGERVAVIMLTRPAYRLGETVYSIIDFGNAQVPCYAVHAALESSEKVDSTIALRSEASIHRVTRRIHASQSESTLFARRIVFSPTIPITATPTFITSGVSLEWKILIEFATPRLDANLDKDPDRQSELLEEVSRDERGSVFAAAEVLDCESFEIAVPLTVYGAASGLMDKDEIPKGVII